MTALARRPTAERRLQLRSDIVLLGPALLLFAVILAAPLFLMTVASFNPSVRGDAGIESALSLENYVRLVTTDLYPAALARSMLFGALTALICIVLAYPVAFVMAFSTDLRIITALTIFLLIPFQLDVVVRLLGLVVLMGDNGLINSALADLGLIDQPLPLMYNEFGVIVGTTSFMLPFVVFTLVGAIRTIDPELISAGRSLGSTYWRSFLKIFLPLSIPGIVAGALVAFTLTVSNFVVPVIMSSYRSQVLPALMHEQVVVVANFRFAAAMGVTLFAVSLITIFVGYRVLRRIVGIGA